MQEAREVFVWTIGYFICTIGFRRETALWRSARRSFINFIASSVPAPKEQALRGALLGIRSARQAPSLLWGLLCADLPDLLRTITLFSAENLRRNKKKHLSIYGRCVMIGKLKNHVCGFQRRCLRIRSRRKHKMQTEDKPNGGKRHERYFNEAASGSRSAFRTSDKKMEP